MVTALQQDPGASLDALLPEENPRDLSDPARLTVGDSHYDAAEVIRVLRPHLTPERLQRVDDVVAARTRSVAVVVEGLANHGNVSAVMRSAEALGFLDFHVIHRDLRYKTSKRTTQGAEKWLDIYRWDSPDACADHLRDRGFHLIGTHLDAAEPISRFNFTEGKFALIFGNEREGLSEAMLRQCDARMIIPIAGFAQSFNISVAAAIALYHIHLERSRGTGSSGDLTHSERLVLTADYLIRSSGAASAILRREARPIDGA